MYDSLALTSPSPASSTTFLSLNGCLMMVSRLYPHAPGLPFELHPSTYSLPPTLHPPRVLLRAWPPFSWLRPLPLLHLCDYRSTGTSLVGNSWPKRRQHRRTRTQGRVRYNVSVSQRYEDWRRWSRTYAGRIFEHGSPVSGLSRIVCNISAFSAPETTNTAR